MSSRSPTPAPISPATDIAFEDNISAFLSGTTVAALPAAGFCGAGSSIASTSICGDLHLAMFGGNLTPGGSCTFTVDLLLPVGGAPGIYVNTTSPIGATVAGLPQLGRPASDTLTVVTGPRLSKEFTDDPAAPGGTTTLEFTIVHDPASSADATAIAFSDDLNATLSGLAAVGLPINDICGPGSVLSGTTNLDPDWRQPDSRILLHLQRTAPGARSGTPGGVSQHHMRPHGRRRGCRHTRATPLRTPFRSPVSPCRSPSPMIR